MTHEEFLAALDECQRGVMAKMTARVVADMERSVREEHDRELLLALARRLMDVPDAPVIVEGS